MIDSLRPENRLYEFCRIMIMGYSPFLLAHMSVLNFEEPIQIQAELKL